jgi:hypothetical protein
MREVGLFIVVTLFALFCVVTGIYNTSIVFGILFGLAMCFEGVLVIYFSILLFVKAIDHL